MCGISHCDATFPCLYLYMALLTCRPSTSLATRMLMPSSSLLLLSDTNCCFVGIKHKKVGNKSQGLKYHEKYSLRLTMGSSKILFLAVQRYQSTAEGKRDGGRCDKTPSLQVPSKIDQNGVFPSLGLDVRCWVLLLYLSASPMQECGQANLKSRGRHSPHFGRLTAISQQNSQTICKSFWCTTQGI